MSSHREAPEISKDPVADSTDLYAFVSPNQPDTVTLISNYIPLQEPSGGPNFYEFGNVVLYEIHVDNDGDGESDVTYQFRFHTRLSTPSSFLYNTGPIGSLSDPNWNSKQFYSVTRVDRHGSHVLGRNLACPPCNVGVLSTHPTMRPSSAGTRCTRSGTGSRYSLASALKSSTLTWGPSSTWVTCARCRRRTSSARQPA